ncbi:MAG: hypothetical protein QF886_24845, partial [Planctomycetota bacterium]|nr:hypothetical protein [Planctomycetota bacterium]
SNSKEELREFWLKSEEFLACQRLVLNPGKTRIFQSREGVSFVGFHIRPDRVRVNPAGIRRFRFRMKARQDAFRQGLIDVDSIRCSVLGWLGHVQHGDTWHMAEGILREIKFQRDSSMMNGAR